MFFETFIAFDWPQKGVKSVKKASVRRQKENGTATHKCGVSK